MPVSTAEVAAVRALLLRDAENTVPLTAQLGDEGMLGYQYLLDAALSVAAGRRFPTSFTSADLVRYVAHVRGSRIADGDEYDFDPVIGENVLRSSLGQNVPGTADPETRFPAVIALLDALTESELSSEADVDDLLAEARKLAEQRLAREHR